MTTQKICLIVAVSLFSISSVTAACSSFQQVFECSSFSKAIFASFFSSAVAAPARGCRKMTPSQWAEVGCHNPRSHRNTNVCVPTEYGDILQQLGAIAVALKNKILVKDPYNRDTLFNTERGRELMRHELTHIRQQSNIPAYTFGLLYITAYCDAGCSYSANRYVHQIFSILVWIQWATSCSLSCGSTEIVTLNVSFPLLHVCLDSSLILVSKSKREVTRRELAELAIFVSFCCGFGSIEAVRSLALYCWPEVLENESRLSRVSSPTRVNQISTQEKSILFTNSLFLCKYPVRTFT